MDINSLNEAINLKGTAEAFKNCCEAKTKFFDQLRGIVADLAPALLEKNKLDLEDYKKTLDNYAAAHKFDNYEFRYNKKYTTSAIFVPVKEMAICAHDTLTFKGRKADHPEILVFVVSTQPAEGAEAIADRTVEINEDLFIDWLRRGMVH